MFGAHLLFLEGKQCFNLYLNQIFKLEYLGSRECMNHLHNETTKDLYGFMIPRPPTILGAHTSSQQFLAIVVSSTPPHKKLCNKALPYLKAFFDPPNKDEEP
jgi:hypothetical protein